MGCGGSVPKEDKEDKEDKERRIKVKRHRSEVLKAMEQQYAESAKMMDDPCLTHTLSVLAELPAPVIVWQMDGTVLLANVASLQLLQRDVERFIGGCHLSKMVIIPLELHKDYTQLTFKELTGAGGILESGERTEISISTSIMEVSGVELYVGTLREGEWIIPHEGELQSPPALKVPPIQKVEVIEDNDNDNDKDAGKENEKDPGRLSSFPLIPGVTGGLTVTADQTDDKCSRKSSRMSSQLSLSSPIHQRPRNQVHFSRAQVSADVLLVLDSMKHPAMLTTAKGQILHWNAGCERVFGPTAEEATGHMIEMLIPYPYQEYHHKYLFENLRRPKADKGDRTPKSKKNDKANRLTSMPRQDFVSRAHDMIARRIDSPSQIALREKGLECPSPDLLIMRMMVTEMSSCGDVLWMVILNECEIASQRHRLLLAEAHLETNHHPAMLPKEHPPLPVAQGRSVYFSPSGRRLSTSSPTAGKYESVSLRAGNVDEPSGSAGSECDSGAMQQLPTVTSFVHN
eukprot:Hpha_TRINITY_DN16814_c5_g1::TRINITY_DN16814_c5_g1_i1::g.151591::m.151591